MCEVGLKPFSIAKVTVTVTGRVKTWTSVDIVGILLDKYGLHAVF